jgi:UDP-N-acetylglucosamine 4,6-dehydratase (inverting)
VLSEKVLLVTGGTGSFGKCFIDHVLRSYPRLKKVIVYSRDELKQFEMSQDPRFRPHLDKMRFFIGDVRDGQRLLRACEDVDIIVHAAALKQVPAAEYNPMECIKTNILGASNVIEAALSSKVERVIALSTDKAAAPINLYGATKLCSDKLFIAANNMRGNRNLKFCVVRYGNVMGSRGSVIPFFIEKSRQNEEMPVTDSRMTRFNITLDKGVELVLFAMKNTWGGEIFVPKIPSYRIMDVVAAINPDAKVKVVGIRPGEKLHEEMITESDSLSTLDCGAYYVIMPQSPSWSFDDFKREFRATPVKEGFRYNSGTNEEWLDVSTLKKLIAVM